MSVVAEWDAKVAAFKADTGIDLRTVRSYEKPDPYQTFVNWEEWKAGSAVCECGETENSHSVPMGLRLTGYFGPDGPALRFGPGSHCYVCRCRVFRPVERPPWLRATPESP